MDGKSERTVDEVARVRLGARHAVAVNSCTATMHISLEAMGIGSGDEVILPALTFAATGEVVRTIGVRPVLVDEAVTGLTARHRR